MFKSRRGVWVITAVGAVFLHFYPTRRALSTSIGKILIRIPSVLKAVLYLTVLNSFIRRLFFHVTMIFHYMCFSIGDYKRLI